MSEKMTFEAWKAEVVRYLHERTHTKGEEYFWLIGGDEDMRPAYDDGDSPADFVEYAIECAV